MKEFKAEEISRLEELANERAAAKRLIEELEAQVKKSEDEMKEIIGDCEESIEAGTRKITFKTVERATVDSKGLKKFLPDIYEKFTKVSLSRRLTVV